jgi:hypothetical protein
VLLVDQVAVDQVAAQAQVLGVRLLLQVKVTLVVAVMVLVSHTAVVAVAVLVLREMMVVHYQTALVVLVQLLH